MSSLITHLVTSPLVPIGRRTIHAHAPQALPALRSYCDELRDDSRGMIDPCLLVRGCFASQTMMSNILYMANDTLPDVDAIQARASAPLL